MKQVKIEHIDNLRKGKKSGAKIGSRAVPHHLYKHEELQYQRALKNKYLEVTIKDRVNLQNIWEKVCIARRWNNYILVKNTEKNTGEILKDFKILESGELQKMKQLIKNYV